MGGGGTGWWWAEKGRKEAAVPGGLQRREGAGSLRGQGWEPHFLAPWGEACRGPIAKTTRHGLGGWGACLSHQLTMGSTSASRSKSSWISSVLPESLLATELGDGEFLEGHNRTGDLRGQPGADSRKDGAAPPGKPSLHGRSSPRPTFSASLRIFEVQGLNKALETSCDALVLSTPWEQEPWVQLSFYTPIIWAMNSEPKGRPQRRAVNSAGFGFSAYHC